MVKKTNPERRNMGLFDSLNSHPVLFGIVMILKGLVLGIAILFVSYILFGESIVAYTLMLFAFITWRIDKIWREINNYEKETIGSNVSFGIGNVLGRDTDNSTVSIRNK